MNPSETKERAWKHLGENGGWFAAIFGTALSMIAAYAINSTVQGICGIDAIFESLKEIQPGSANAEEALATISKSMMAASAALLAALYVEAVFRYGLSALSIAVVRGGARVSHAFSGFGKGVSTLWLMAIAQTYVFFWTLLFVIPGIRAAFSYALVYMLKADHPDWRAGRCISESKRLMEGNRMRYFELWLSFIGWWILCFATCGLAAFFAIPYYNAAKAAFYEDLLDRDSVPQASGGAPEAASSGDFLKQVYGDGGANP